MNIFYIKNNCLEATKKALQVLMYEHFEALGRPKSEEHIAKAIDLALQASSNAAFLAIGKTATELFGCCFFNVCYGIGSGGKYIWFNDIYVKADFRKKGYAAILVDGLLKWAKENECVYIAACRDNDNMASKALFEKMDFEQSGMIWLDKGIGI
ncbi:MAG: GNAT family N-acetyltransferase [Chitinophagales bacterium]